MIRLVWLALLVAPLAWAEDAGTPTSATPAPPVARVWHVPGAIEAADMPGRTDAFGTPVSMHAVRSRLPLEALVQDFVGQFQKAGLFIPPKGAIFPSSSHLQLTGLDPDTFIAYTIFFQENPDGSTTAILTETYLAERRRAAGKVDFAPVMPGAHDVLVTRNEGLDLAHYRVRARPSELAAFQDRSLRGAGFQKTGPGVWQRGEDLLHFSFRAVEQGEIEVLVMHRRAPTAIDPIQEEGGAP